MSIKLIATDLDGTLMSPDHLTVSPRTVKALKAAHEKGVKIAIATGRPMCIIGSVVEQVNFVDYIIFSNGACVFDRKKDKNVYENLIPFEDIKELIKYFLKYEVYFDVSYKGESHYQRGIEKYFMDDSEFPNDFVEEVRKTMNPHDDLAEFLNGDGVEKITLYTVKPENEKEFREKLLSYNLSVASSFKGCLEATANGVDKGKAVEGLCTELGITAQNTMTFGDAGNDCQMLEFADYSFAMGNGTEECKKSAKHIAPSNAEDGLAKTVEKYVLGR